MLWADQWRRLSRWFERLPLWVQVTAFPLVAPAVFAFAATCLCPRTAAAATLLLVVVYGLLLRHGLLGWSEVGGTLGTMYLFFVVMGYLGMLQRLSERVFDWLTGRRSARSGQESQTPSSPGTNRVEPDAALDRHRE
jgi:hypothetical protein